MKTPKSLLALSAVAALVAAGEAVAAKTPDPVACTLRADYSINRVLRVPFTHAFTFVPGTIYDFDFSNAIRFRYLQAKAEVDAVTGQTIVMVNYYNDVSPFTFVELGTTVRIRNNNEAFDSEGKSTFFTEFGTAGEHTTDYALSCAIAK